MADSTFIYGFGTTERPFIERPPLPRAEFQLPPDAYMAGMVTTREYVELRIRVPLVADAAPPALSPELAAQIRRGIDEAERGETVDRGSFAQYLDEDDDD